MLKRSPRLALLVPAVVAFVALTASFAQALPATVANDTGMVDGPVRAIAQAGNLMWIGGQFNNVLDQLGNNLEPASNLAVVDATTGVAVTSITLPVVTWTAGPATVYDMSLAPDGTLYFAGNFDAVNGVTRFNVAAINSVTGALLPFAPHSEAAQAVYTNGSVVYVGGLYLRAFRTNGTALAGWSSPETWISPTLRGHTVYATFRDIVQMGGTLVAACVCDKMFDANHPSPDGVSVKAVVEIDAATGILRSWAPSNLPLGASGAAAFGESVVLHAAPDTGLTTVYLGAGGNDFTAAYDFQTGQQVWRTDTSGSSQAVAWHQGTLIVGGHFEWTGKTPASNCGDNDHPNPADCYGTPKLAAMNPVDGSMVIDPATSQPWNPTVCCKYNGIWALTVNRNDSTLWVGGEFTKVGGTWSYDVPTNTWSQLHGVKQSYFAQLNAPSATVHPLIVVSVDIGTGVGSVTSDLGGINCGSACAADYAGGTVVTLTATPAAGFAFLGWAGDCAGMVSPCQVTMSQARNVTASFGVPTYPLTASKTGGGKGKVTSDIGGINCGTNTTACSANILTGSSVTLTALATAGYIFTAWGGDCTGTDPALPCVLTMDQAHSVSVNFEQARNLTLTFAGAGAGLVTSSPAGVNCVATCAVPFAMGSVITLTATPDANSTFSGWSLTNPPGLCSGTGTCQLTMSQARMVTATFAPILHQLTASKAGDGSGNVASDLGLINCGATCADQYASGTVVTLTATPDAASSFDGWSGDCTGTDPCQVTLSQAGNVTATFTHVFHQLTVVPQGAGTGYISSQPAAIDCGATCSAAVLQATQVTLTAVADPGDTFMGWGGDCAGIGTCVLTMDGDHSVTATFTPAYDLVITKAGAGDGTVTSDPAGIDCSPTCTWGFLDGTLVTLTAAPDAGSSFSGWTGDCTGSGPTCQVTVDAVKGVTATFDAVYHQLTVTPAGDGSGSVSSDTGGIDCGATCSVPVRQPTPVTLTATAAAGSIFTGWSGDCAGTQATCPLTMDADHGATATFMLLFPLNVTLAGPGGGTVSSDVGAIACGPTCGEIYTSGTAVTLTATPDANSTFTGWSGDVTCPGTGTCSMTMSQLRNVTATFDQIPRQLTVTKIGTGGTVTSAPAGIDCGATCVANFPQPTAVTLTATPSFGWFFSGWGGDCAGTDPCQVTMDQAHTVSATFAQGAGCGKILFTSRRKSNVDIYVMNGDGSNQTRLTTALGSDLQPSWSPDCARIAFTGTGTGSEQVYVMNANGTGRTQLTTSGDNNQPTWSPDGTKIAFVSDRTGPQKIFVMNANGTGATEISDTSNVSDTHPDWSPNGARIVFTSKRSGGYQVWVMNADGTNPIRVTKQLQACQDPSWSPDGLKVVFVSKMTGTLQVWTANANGTGAFQVSTTGKPDSQPTWSPDGTKIAFSSTATGHAQIWVVNVNGTGAVNVSNAVGKDTLPNWS